MRDFANLRNVHEFHLSSPPSFPAFLPSPSLLEGKGHGRKGTKVPPGQLKVLKIRLSTQYPSSLFLSQFKGQFRIKTKLSSTANWF